MGKKTLLLIFSKEAFLMQIGYLQLPKTYFLKEIRLYGAVGKPVTKN